MDFTQAGTDLEQAAAALLLRLDVGANPAFAELGRGSSDEELMVKADPFAAAARRNAAANNSNNTTGIGNVNNNHNNNNVSFSIPAFAPHKNAPIEEFAAAATNSARAATASLLAATLTLSATSQNTHSKNSGDQANNNNAENNNNSSNYHHQTFASFEIEAFRSALKQQRAPSLRLLVAVSKTAVPVLMCVLCNAQPFSSFDEFCSGGRFDSLYYDAKFRTARDHEKQKKKDRERRIEERRHCLFIPRTKDEIGAELIARKRGDAYVDPKEEALAAKEAAAIDRQNKSLIIPGETNLNNNNAQESADAKEAKEAKEKKEQDDAESTSAPKAPDAFFNYNIQWKNQKKKKLDKKIAKLQKEQEEEDEETYRQWKMSDESRKLAAKYKEKQELGLLPIREKPNQYTFHPSITPFRSTRKDPLLHEHADVVERLQIDITKRKEDQILREIEEIGRFRAKTPKIHTNKMTEVFAELHHPTPKKTTTFRKPAAFETPTFSPKISRGPRAVTPSSTMRQPSAGDNKGKNNKNNSAGDQSRERHSHRCIQPYAVSTVEQLHLSAKPVTDSQAADRYKRNMEEMRIREQKLQEIRDGIAKKQAEECTFQNADLILTRKTEEYSSRFYTGVEENLMEVTMTGRQLSKHILMNRRNNNSTSRATSAAASPSPRRELIVTMNNIMVPVKKEFSPIRHDFLSPSRNLLLRDDEVGDETYSKFGTTSKQAVGERAISSSLSKARDNMRRSKETLVPRTALMISPERRRRDEQTENLAENKNNLPKNGTSTRTRPSMVNPADQQMMLQYLSIVFSEMTSRLRGMTIINENNNNRNDEVAPAVFGSLLPCSHAIELCHRIAVQKKITVSRLLKIDEVKMIFPELVSFVDFVKMFEMMVGHSLTEDFL